MFRRTADAIAMVVGAALALLLTVIVVAIFAQVFWRYVLNEPLVWPEEAARYSFIWLSFLGLPLLLRHGEMIAVETVAAALPERVRALLQGLAGLLAVPLLVILVWQGIRLMDVVSGQIAPATGLPSSLLYLAAPVGALLSLFFLAERLIAGPPAPSA
ncbi:MAG: TRAP transporter small permease [Tistlia sp.]|uniref:TRAP transporter small permease n=1 Tax=Tistlia sp. TaxID=3057121 RepID=UPI0034A4E383